MPTRAPDCGFSKGNVADQQLRDLYSIEKQVTEHYPPAYIWQCEADNTVPIQNSAMMVEELKKREFPASTMSIREMLTAGDWLPERPPRDGWMRLWRSGRKFEREERRRKTVKNITK